jgi:hypothetical protein
MFLPLSLGLTSFQLTRLHRGICRLQDWRLQRLVRALLDRKMTTEYEEEVGQGEGRDVGMVLVPSKWWTKVERELLPGEEVDEDKAGCVPA